MNDEPMGDYPSATTAWIAILACLAAAALGITGALIWNL